MDGDEDTTDEEATDGDTTDGESTDGVTTDEDAAEDGPTNLAQVTAIDNPFTNIREE